MSTHKYLSLVSVLAWFRLCWWVSLWGTLGIAETEKTCYKGFFVNIHTVWIQMYMFTFWTFCPLLHNALENFCSMLTFFLFVPHEPSFDDPSRFCNFLWKHPVCRIYTVDPTWINLFHIIQSSQENCTFLINLKKLFAKTSLHFEPLKVFNGEVAAILYECPFFFWHQHWRRIKL